MSDSIPPELVKSIVATWTHQQLEGICISSHIMMICSGWPIGWGSYSEPAEEPKPGLMSRLLTRLEETKNVFFHGADYYREDYDDDEW